MDRRRGRAVTGACALLAVVSGCSNASSEQLQVRVVEEPYLLSAHGLAYVTFAATVGRFIPGLGRLEAVPTTDRSQPTQEVV